MAIAERLRARVREQVGIELEDLTFDEPWLVVDVLANDTDPDPGQALSVSAVTQPANGASAVLSGMAVTYRPNLNFYGNDSFTAKIGAEAIRDMLRALDLGKLAADLRVEIAESTSELKPKKLAKRLTEV